MPLKYTRFDWLKAVLHHLPVDDNDCLNWPFCKESGGYGMVFAFGKVKKVSRVAYELAHGPILGNLVVMHSCDNPLCFNPAHLSLGTKRDNMRDAIKKGRWHHGFKPGHHLRFQPGHTNGIATRFKTGVRNNPKGEFKPGNTTGIATRFRPKSTPA